MCIMVKVSRIKAHVPTLVNTVQKTQTDAANAKYELFDLDRTTKIVGVRCITFGRR